MGACDSWLRSGKQLAIAVKFDDLTPAGPQEVLSVSLLARPAPFILSSSPSVGSNMPRRPGFPSLVVLIGLTDEMLIDSLLPFFSPVSPEH